MRNAVMTTACLGLVALGALPTSATPPVLPKRPAQAKKPNVKVTVMHSWINLTEDAEAIPSRLTVNWYTPKGMRLEQTNGDYMITLSSGKAVYLVSPSEEKAVEISPRHPKLPTPRLDKVTKEFRDFANKFKTTGTRHETVLGKPCEVKEESLILAGTRYVTSTWTAKIGCQEVAMRKTTRVFKGHALQQVETEEVVLIETVTALPGGVLAVPAGYEVKKMDSDAFAGKALDIMKSMKPEPGR